MISRALKGMAPMAQEDEQRGPGMAPAGNPAELGRYSSRNAKGEVVQGVVVAPPKPPEVKGMAPGLSVGGPDVNPGMMPSRLATTGMQMKEAPAGSLAGVGGGMAPLAGPGKVPGIGTQMAAPATNTRVPSAGMAPTFTNIPAYAEQNGLQPVAGMDGVYGNRQLTGKGGLTIVPAGGMNPGDGLQPSAPRQGMAPVFSGKTTDASGKKITPTAGEAATFRMMERQLAQQPAGGMVLPTATTGDVDREGYINNAPSMADLSSGLGSDFGSIMAQRMAGSLAKDAWNREQTNINNRMAFDKQQEEKRQADMKNDPAALAADIELKRAQAGYYDRGRAGSDINVSEVNGSVDTLAQQVVEGRLDPMAISKRGGLQQSVFTKVEELSPGFNLTGASANARYQTNTGNLQSRALIEGITPLFDNLLVAGEKLGNSKFPVFNKATNWVKAQAGDPDIVAFNNARDDLVAEAERVLMGSGVLSDSKYTRALHNLNSAQSPQQLKAAVDQMQLAINSRMHALNTQPVNPVRQQDQAPDLNQQAAPRAVQPAPGQRTVTRRGTAADGRRVVMYDNGEVAYE